MLNLPSSRCRRLLPALFTAPLLLAMACLPDAAAPSAGYRYELFVPAAYAADTTTHWPLILSLHGAGGLQPADNLINVRANAVADFPFIVVSPATTNYWSNTRLIEVLDKVVKTHRVDLDKVYITGISMGAYGGFALASSYPGRFAAMALIAGGGNAAHTCAAKEVPLWAFHNLADPVVPATESETLVGSHLYCGGIARLTVYDEVPAGTWAHNAWHAAWNTDELYTWFLQQSGDAQEFLERPDRRSAAER